MSKAIINFLLGSQPIDGFWFGDNNYERKPFWWRFHLRQYVESKDKEIEDLKKVYNDLAESHAKQVIENNAFKTTIEEYKKSSIGYEMALDKLESELLKAKERFCKCNENDKTGSTSAMHCNHCGKIEQSETWLK